MRIPPELIYWLDKVQLRLNQHQLACENAGLWLADLHLDECEFIGMVRPAEFFPPCVMGKSACLR